jgi:phospholipase C
VPYDHTSTLKLLFLAFGVQPTLTDFRWFNFGDMSESLDFGNAQGAPEGLPTLDNVQAAAAAAVAQAAGGVAAAQETPPSPEPPFPPTALFPAKPLHPVGDNSPLIPPGCASVPLTVFKNAIKLASDRAQSLLGRR